MAADNKLTGLEVAARLQARALDDLAGEIGDLELAVGRTEAAAKAATAEIAALRAEIAASRASTEAAVSLLKEMESKSLPSRIFGWALANPIPAVVIVGLLLLAQSGYSYLIPQLLGGVSNANPALVHPVSPAPSPAPPAPSAP